MTRLLALVGACLLLQAYPRPLLPGGTTASSQLISAVAMVSWVAHLTPDPILDMVVVWRGSPGWFRRGDHASQSGGGSRDYVHSTIEYGGIQLQAELNLKTRMAHVNGKAVPLGTDNVILVDDVDGPRGASVVRTLHVVPTMPLHPVAAAPPDIVPVLGRSSEIVSFLRCDVKLDGLAQMTIDVLCARVQGGATADRPVDSIAALQARLVAAKPGDRIVVKDGTYTTTAPIAVHGKGTAAAPIRIAAETVGGVTISGAAGFDVAADAAYVEIDGFTFGHRAGTTHVRSGATHVRFTHNVFECSGDGAYLTVAGDDTEIDRNEFRNKRTLGNMIDVRGAGSQVARRVRIHDNFFHDFTSPGPGTNGAETIRFGLSGLSMSAGNAIIEHNLFSRCTGENEMLSIKSGGNVIRGNTLLDSPGAQLTLRHGNGSEVAGNYLRGTDGIRVFGDRNVVRDNYLIANTTGIQIGNGDGEVAEGAALTSHDRPDGTLITGNILIDNGRHYVMAPRDKGLGATATTFADNLIRGGGVAATIDGPYPGAVWRENVIWQATSVGSIPAGGYVERPPSVRPVEPLNADEILAAIRQRQML